MRDTGSDGVSPPEGNLREPRRLLALLDFLRSESAGGVALIGAACVALAWSNSPWHRSYDRLLALPVEVAFGRERLALSFQGTVNDALMAIFFLVVALEIRRELTEGALASRARAAAPCLGALGGMAIPALLFVAINRDDPATLEGWAVPVATDIAFVLASLSALGRRVPVGLKVFLTALAIIDDLGAIVVIALFYTADLDVEALAWAGAAWCGMFALNRAGVRILPPFLAGGVLLWCLVLRSGIHPTLAGVALAFAVPSEGGAARRLEHAVGDVVTFVVLPLFGLANAGLRLSEVRPDAALSPLVLGIVAALVIGKPVGVLGATLGAARLGLARMPAGVSVPVLSGGAILCGIGFTMSLFIGSLAFGASTAGTDTKLAVFAGSLLSAAAGIGVIAVAGRRKPDGSAGR